MSTDLDELLADSPSIVDAYLSTITAAAGPEANTGAPPAPKLGWTLVKSVTTLSIRAFVAAAHKKRVQQFNTPRLGAQQQQEMVQAAGHAGALKKAEGFLLKDLTETEFEALNRLHADPLGSFAPEFEGSVEVDDKKFIKMQDVLFGMTAANIMDIKIGTRTFQEDEANNNKPRMDLLEKAKKLVAANPSRAQLTPEQLANGMRKIDFMTMRDQLSTSAALGFRINGMALSDGSVIKPDCSDTDSLKKDLRKFIFMAHPTQRTAISRRLHQFREECEVSEFFHKSEIIGSSIFCTLDRNNIYHSGVWMIDFGKTTESATRLNHRTPWKLGNREDGYLTGLDNLIAIWDELCAENSPSIHDHDFLSGHNASAQPGTVEFTEEFEIL